MSSDRKFCYNKLFIIGNGFDLAMGLQSSYSDFMMDYFIQLMNKSNVSKVSNAKQNIRSNYYQASFDYFSAYPH